MNLSKSTLDNKYVHRALTDMGAYKKNTRDLKRTFTDKSRKYKGNRVLKARYVNDFKARCSALEFDEHFTSMKNTFPNGRVTKTYLLEQTVELKQKAKEVDKQFAQLAASHADTREICAFRNREIERIEHMFDDGSTFV